MTQMSFGNTVKKDNTPEIASIKKRAVCSIQKTKSKQLWELSHMPDFPSTKLGSPFRKKKRNLALMVLPYQDVGFLSEFSVSVAQKNQIGSPKMSLMYFVHQWCTADVQSQGTREGWCRCQQWQSTLTGFFICFWCNFLAPCDYCLAKRPTK